MVGLDLDERRLDRLADLAEKAGAPRVKDAARRRIGGGRDVSDIHKIVAKLTSEIAGARKHVMPGAGHLVPMEKPGEFNRLALDFIARSKR